MSADSDHGGGNKNPKFARGNDDKDLFIPPHCPPEQTDEGVKDMEEGFRGSFVMEQASTCTEKGSFQEFRLCDGLGTIFNT